MRQQNDVSNSLPGSADPRSCIDLNQLKCISIAKEADDSIRIGRLTGWAEGVEVFRVRNVLYVPQYGIPVCNGFVPEEAISHRGHLDVRLGRKPGEILPSASDRIIYPETIESSSAEVCVLGNIYSHVFGHWYEELLKVIVLEAFGFDGSYVIPAWYPDFSRESLALLGISPERIASVSAPTIYRTALFISTISKANASQFPGIVLRLRDCLYDAAALDSGVGDRIWVERGNGAKNTQQRGVVNTEEIYSCINKHGFVSVDFGAHPMKKQIAIDREMDVMLGPHGSAFAHCGFMAMRREVIEIFSPNYINTTMFQLCLVMKHSYKQMVHRHAWHKPYKFGVDIMVDIVHLELVLSSLRPRRKKLFGLWGLSTARKSSKCGNLQT